MQANAWSATRARCICTPCVRPGRSGSSLRHPHTPSGRCALSVVHTGQRGRLPSARSVRAPSAADPSGPSITKPLPAQRLIQLFCEVQHPAYSNRRYSLAVIDFVNEAVLAYECGVTEAELQRQVAPSLTRLRDSAPPSSLLARSTADFCEQGFMRAVLIVWVTLMLSPRSVKRWAHTPAVSDEALAVWRGFISMIVSGYFERRMAWYPLDRLQLELSAVQGRATNQDQVAEYARLTYTTLEKVYPQFPAD